LGFKLSMVGRRLQCYTTICEGLICIFDLHRPPGGREITVSSSREEDVRGAGGGPTPQQRAALRLLSGRLLPVEGGGALRLARSPAVCFVRLCVLPAGAFCRGVLSVRFARRCVLSVTVFCPHTAEGRASRPSRPDIQTGITASDSYDDDKKQAAQACHIVGTNACQRQCRCPQAHDWLSGRHACCGLQGV
jgi:hypothetical protein